MFQNFFFYEKFFYDNEKFKIPSKNYQLNENNLNGKEIQIGHSLQLPNDSAKAKIIS